VGAIRAILVHSVAPAYASCRSAVAEELQCHYGFAYVYVRAAVELAWVFEKRRPLVTGAGAPDQGST
jgi:hypothetical protein